MEKQNRKRTKKRLLWAALGCLFVVGTVVMADSILLPGLISDQKMIDNFNAHKPEFNALVQTYLKYGRRPLEWANRPEVMALKAKTGVAIMSDGPDYWFDNPYSLEAAEKVKQINDEGTWEQNHFRTTAIVEINDRRYRSFYWLMGGGNWKDYYYFPIDPDIEKGRLKMPRLLYGTKFPRTGYRVLDSTDSLHWWSWSWGECVVRKIEPHWYIHRCRTH